MEPNLENFTYDAMGEPIADIMLRYNLTIDEINAINGANFQEGDILAQDIYLPPDKVDPVVDDGGRIVGFLPTTEALPPPPTPFDPTQATSDWLSAVYGDQATTFAGQEEALRQEMLINAYILMHYTDGWEGDVPTPQEFIAAFSDVSSDEIAIFSAEVSAYAQDQFHNVMSANELPDDMAFMALETELADTYGMNTDQSGIGIENIHDLATKSVSYLSVLGLDDLRQENQLWNPEQFQAELEALMSLVKQMPTEPILGISPAPVKKAFQKVVRDFQKEFEENQHNRGFIEDYETERAQRMKDEERRNSLSLPWWIELPAGVLLEPVDIAMSLRDVVIFGDPAGLLGLIPFVPNSVTSRLGRVAQATNRALNMLPGAGDVMNTLNRGTDAITQSARALGRRFDRIDGGFQYNYGMTPAYQGAGYGDNIVYMSNKNPYDDLPDDAWNSSPNPYDDLPDDAWNNPTSQQSTPQSNVEKTPRGRVVYDDHVDKLDERFGEDWTDIDDTIDKPDVVKTQNDGNKVHIKENSDGTYTLVTTTPDEKRVVTAFIVKNITELEKQALRYGYTIDRGDL